MRHCFSPHVILNYFSPVPYSMPDPPARPSYLCPLALLPGLGSLPPCRSASKLSLPLSPPVTLPLSLFNSPLFFMFLSASGHLHLPVVAFRSFLGHGRRNPPRLKDLDGIVSFRIGQIDSPTPMPCFCYCHLHVPRSPVSTSSNCIFDPPLFFFRSLFR